MKKLALAAALFLAASPSLAISRYNPMSMTCQSARAAIHNQGAVIFRWTSPRGLPLYDRYVRNSRYCDANEYAEWKNIPTRDDRSCPVLNCQSIDNLDGMFFIPNHSL
ncbi:MULTISPECIES: hypothetical protein [Rhizobium]|jgi:hypothetical protein|uniref:KTSC domain-containing protein n=3 Tax=Rhizobium TaxID=379 RepID=A0A7W6WDA5_9HYPH|nr:MULTISPECIES: hypothetical protein [Rhizobium]OWK24109.1 hypothetical protein AJ87_25820 [Rhizobium yanglingense]APO67138.1 hypothetical protein IE4872_CH01492 [Rhizobium gallicum]MBB4228390.1 hypothetical protein [Rhizobium mongolense]MBB4273891.1 hypothetical protein [Rhizobium mongolense]QPB20914.1 hypothetical protein ISN39_05300 [Rhizobium sp. 007]